MTKFILTYHGGATPENTTQEERNQIMAAWGAWMEGLGEALTDPGNPAGSQKTVSPNGSVEDGGGPNPITGYTLVNAADMDAALAMAKGSPHLESGGTITVVEAIEM